jgi:hypothetical protein
LDAQLMASAFRLADSSAGSSSAARMAMMAMTTSSSISVNAFVFLNFKLGGWIMKNMVY